MKNWIKNNWNTFVVGYAIGITTMVIFDLIDSIVMKIAILITQQQYYLLLLYNVIVSFNGVKFKKKL